MKRHDLLPSQEEQHRNRERRQPYLVTTKQREEGLASSSALALTRTVEVGGVASSSTLTYYLDTRKGGRFHEDGSVEKGWRGVKGDETRVNFEIRRTVHQRRAKPEGGQKWHGFDRPTNARAKTRPSRRGKVGGPKQERLFPLRTQFGSSNHYFHQPNLQTEGCSRLSRIAGTVSAV